jgi:hypothetical protein
MIYEYALEPEMVATCSGRHTQGLYFREFGPGKGRLVSRYPKKWAKRVWDAFCGGNDMDRKRLEEILVRLKGSMVKRKNCQWDEGGRSWLKNVLHEHERFPFFAIMARNNPGNRPEIFTENDITRGEDLPKWDVPHGIIVNRKIEEMAAAVEMMLTLCRWVKFVDPYFSFAKKRHVKSLSAFLAILGKKRPVGPPEEIEIHTSGEGASIDHLKESFEEIIPAGLTITLFQWQEKPGGQRLHNRYILTDLGGVAFLHGLDTGAEGEADDITRLDRKPYQSHCREYDPTDPAFDNASPPLRITGILGV